MGLGPFDIDHYDAVFELWLAPDGVGLSDSDCVEGGARFHHLAVERSWRRDGRHDRAEIAMLSKELKAR